MNRRAIAVALGVLVATLFSAAAVLVVGLAQNYLEYGVLRPVGASTTGADLLILIVFAAIVVIVLGLPLLALLIWLDALSLKAFVLAGAAGGLFTIELYVSHDITTALPASSTQ
jgi:hypothetical protein